MEKQYQEKCPSCEAEIWYSENEQLIKCSSCGNTFRIAEFVREQQKIEQRLAEGEKAKEELEKATQERQKAQEALSETVRALDNIQIDQRVQTEKLKRILEKQESSSVVQDNMLSLIQTLQSGQKGEQDFLYRFLHNIVAGQKTADDKLRSISEMAEQLLHNKNKTENIMSLLLEKLSGSEQEKQRLINEFELWSKTNHKEDIERLTKIRDCSENILNQIYNLDEKIDLLNKDLSKVEKAIKGFETKWENDKRVKLVEKYKYAEKLQKEHRFDEAEKLYVDVTLNGGKEPEVYWRIILCHYCVVSQTDNEDKRIFTVLYPDLTDPNEMAIWKELKASFQNDDQREYYLEKINRLQEVLQKYRDVRFQNEYDVFISAKQAIWQDGRKYYTFDHEIGHVLYDHLTSLGLKVFNSEERACKCPPGQEWEPYILSALLTSRIMIVVGSCKEYMESQWVKNEWSRFQWLQKHESDEGKTKREILCYISDGMNPKDIPIGLNPNRQAIVNNADAFLTLDAEVKKVFPIIPNIVHGPSFDEIVAKMEAWLADAQYEKVVNTYNALIEEGQFLNEPKLYLYRLCADKRVGDFDELAEEKKIVLQEERLFKLAIRKGTNQKDKELLDRLVKTNKVNMGKSDASVSEVVFEKYDGNVNGTDLPDDVNNRQMQEVQDCDGNGQEQYSCGDYSYIVLDNGNAKITDYSGIAPHVEIPDKLNDYTVTIIGSRAFSSAFESLYSVRIPDNVISIEQYAFSGCHHLKSIDFPSGLTRIGDSAFINCSSLESVDIPDSLCWIETNPFRGCDKLTRVNLSPHHLHFEVVNNCLFNKADKKLICCLGSTNVEDFEIPEGTSSIGDSAFEYCHYIKKIIIPSSVTQIGNCAFSNCTSLTQVLMHKGVSSIGDNAFYYCISLTNIDLPDSIIDIGNNPFIECESLTKIGILPNPYIEYADGALICKHDHRLICYLPAMKEEGYIIPEGIQEIGVEAFWYCENLKYIQIPQCVNRIGKSAFAGCTALEKIYIPEGIKDIKEETFASCQSLEITSLPESVKNIEKYAFDGVNKDLIIYAVIGSYAEQFCKEHNMKVIAYTKV